MSLPLEGIVVLDFTRHLPGPYATDILRRLGARVLKVEPPDGDPTRWLPPFDREHGALFKLINGGKESLVVDLKKPEGREFIHALVPFADIVVESYRPGVAARFDIDAASLRAINQRLIYCSISGFGGGRERSAHDLNFVALSGLLDLQRDPSGTPVLPATQIGDMSGALYAALLILAALHGRDRTGEGACLDVSMAAAARAIMPTAEALYRGSHHTPETFWLTGGLPNYTLYRTRDGGFLAVASLEPHFWESFCTAIGHPELVPLQFDLGARERVTRTIAATIVSRDRSEWEGVFEGVDACVEPVLTIEESHLRFGDPLVNGPLQTNYPTGPLEPPTLGSSFDAAADLAEMSADERKRRSKGGAFEPGSRLKQFFRRSVLKLGEW
jgi:alpha-methylacyl-CoA racemase